MRTTNTVARIAVATAILLTCSAGSASAGTNTVTFTQVGEHALTIPSGVTSLRVVAVGGKGGTSVSSAAGGFGARVTGDLAVQPGTIRYLVVGGNGVNGDYAGGGGGASDVRTAPVSAGITPTDPRLLIAGGGGGGGHGIVDTTTPPGGRGGDGGQPGQTSRSGAGMTPSGGGAAGVPSGTGAGGTAGHPPGNPSFGASGLAGGFGVGGTGAYPGSMGIPGAGGYNGGGLGGGYSLGGTLYMGGGGGGGGLNGGGGGGGMGNAGGATPGGGGGGGGSNLVPAGGSVAADTSGAGSIAVSFTDTTAPVVSMAAVPARVPGTMQVSGSSGTALGDGAVTVKVYTGSVASGAPLFTPSVTRDAGTGAYHATVSWFQDGTYTVQASQVDGAGNVSLAAARTFFLDNTAPTLSLASPANGVVLTTAVPVFSGIAGTATGDAASVQVELRNAANAVVETVSGQRDGTTGAYAIPASPALQDGSYTALVRQSDDVGNAGASPAVTFQIDAQAPAPTLTAPAVGRSGDATPTFAGTGATAAGDANAVEVRIHAGTSTAGAVLRTLHATLDGAGAYMVDAAPLGDGVYTVQTSQSDLAGNVGRSPPRTFTVDTTAPTVTLDTASGLTPPALPTFAGSGGTAAGDDATVTVAVHAGSSAAGPLVTTIDTTRDGQTGAGRPRRHSRSRRAPTPRSPRSATTSPTPA